MTLHTYHCPGYPPIKAPSHHDAALQVIEQEKARASALHAISHGWAPPATGPIETVHRFTIIGPTVSIFTFSITQEPTP